MRKILAIPLLVVVTSGYAQTDTGVSKKNYNLFNPTPKTLIGDFITDRPDATESPNTVDAGHLQVEMDLFKTEHFKTGGITTVNNFYNAVNIRAGITNSLDLHLAVSSLEVSTIDNGISKTKTSRFGGLTLKVKQNLWGNDNGPSALAIFPFVNIPLRHGEKFSGGILVPFSLSLGKGWDFGTQIEADIANGTMSNSYYFNFLTSATVSHSLFKGLNFFAEGVLSRNNELKVYEYFLDGGFVFALSPSVHIDTGIFYGIKDISPTTYFLGLTFRI